MGIVLMNAADPRRGEQYRFGPMLVEPAIDRRLVAQINCIAARRSESGIPAAPADALSAEPTMPRWPATKMHRPSSGNSAREAIAFSRFPPSRPLGPGRKIQPGSRSAPAAQGRYHARPSSRPAPRR